MSLDQNLFTLHVTPNKDDSNVVDLVDPSGIIHYRKRRIPGIEYKVEVIDPLSESLLITANAPSATSKTKVLELYNPTTIVELKYTGTISFRWSFKWEEHEFEWKREECYMIRKPDPPVLVAVTKEPTGRLRTTSVQILDYNLNRFDIDDRKGLEIVILTALLTFRDANDTYHAKERSSSAASARPTVLNYNRGTSRSGSVDDDNKPTPPPKPAPKTGLDRIAEMQAQRGEYNEVVVESEGSIEDYAQYCSNLLQDDAMLFITVKSAETSDVPKVLQVVEETKRNRYKAGLDENGELHQYVLYDTEPKKGPKRINLNDDADKKNKYKPPQSLSVHLSKISMPELQPKRNGTEKAPSKESRKEEKVSTQHTASSTPALKKTPNKLKHSRASHLPSEPSSTPTPSQLSNGPALFPPPGKLSNSHHRSPSASSPSTVPLTTSPSFPVPSIASPHPQQSGSSSAALANSQVPSTTSVGKHLPTVAGIFDKFHLRR